MKKRIFKLLFILMIFTIKVNAADNVTIKSVSAGTSPGQYYGTYIAQGEAWESCHYQSTTSSGTVDTSPEAVAKSEAKEKCESAGLCKSSDNTYTSNVYYKRKTGISTYSSTRYSSLTKCQKEEKSATSHKCSDITSESDCEKKGCSYNRGRCSGVYYTCPSGYKLVGTTCKKTYICTSSYEVDYYYHVAKSVAQTFKDCTYNTIVDLGGTQYKMYDGKLSDYTYCVSPGLSGPAGTTYAMNTDFDITKCDDTYYSDGKKNYACGFAAILLQTMKREVDTKNGGYIIKSNGKYSYEAIATALRLMAAYITNDSTTNTISYLGDEFVYVGKTAGYTNTDIFYATAKAAIDGKYGSNNSLVCGKYNIGLICGENSGYKQAIQLFLNAINNSSLYFKEYLKTDLDLGVYVNKTTGIDLSSMSKEEKNKLSKVIETSTSSSTQNIYKINIDLPEVIENTIVACDPVNDENCVIKTVIKDSDGKELTSDYAQGYCTKEKCYVYVNAQKTVCSKNKTSIEYTITTTVRNFGYDMSAYIRQYKNLNSPNGRQIMMTVAYNISALDKEETIESTKEENTIKSPCDCEDSCELSKQEDSKELLSILNENNKTDTVCTKEDIASGNKNCKKYSVCTEKDNEKGYAIRNIEGLKSEGISNVPTSCISDVCESDDIDNDRYNYDLTEKFNNSGNVCNIYCTDDITFVLPTRTTTNSGRQFYYDLMSKMTNEDKKLLVDTSSKDYKITAITVIKRSCVSSIHYNNADYGNKTWKEQFKTLINNIDSTKKIMNKVKGKDNYEEYEVKLNELYNSLIDLIVTLEKCNFYSSSDIEKSIESLKQKISDGYTIGNDYNNILKSLVNDIKLDVSYDDKEYGSNKTFSTKKYEGILNTNYYSTYNTKKQEKTKNKTASETIEGIKITLPTNNYATAEFTVQTDYYHPVEYYTISYTGKALTSSEISDVKNPIKLDKQIFPVSTRGQANDDNKINFKFSNINLINVKGSIYNYTCTYDNYTEFTSNLHTSDEKLGFTYRNIDLNNMFPSSNISSNWKDKTSIKEEIESNGDKIYTDNYKKNSSGDSTLQYSYTLTPYGIKQIKKYNNNNEYQNNTLSNCTVSGNEPNQYYIKCQSDFINDITNNVYKGITSNLERNKSFINSQVGGN